MKQGKIFFRLIGYESLYMLLATLAACGSALLQTLFKRFAYHYSSFIFSGSNYYYNVFMYILGIVIYFSAAYFLYKKYRERFESVTELNILLRIAAWIVFLLWGFIMMISELMVLFALVLGLTNNLIPEILLYISIIGWPIVTVVFFGVLYIRKSLR